MGYGRDLRAFLEYCKKQKGAKIADLKIAVVEKYIHAISKAELAAADVYEVDDYVRVAVPLRSGQTAWVYVFAGQD